MIILYFLLEGFFISFKQIYAKLDLFNNDVIIPISITLDFEEIVIRISQFIKEEVKSSNTKGVVLGLSGGIDSSVAVYLVTRSIDTKDIIGLIIPDTDVTSQEDIEDALSISRILNIRYHLIDITDLKQNYTKLLPENQLSIGNLTARIRMNLIYYYANLNNLLVIGSSDKSELRIGYFTKFGDGAADILPLGDLYKTEVRELASYLNIPSSILNKKSSPALWKGQSAEEEIGMKYSKIDKILKFLEKENMMDISRNKYNHDLPPEIGFDIEDLLFIQNLISKTHHKRNLPKICFLK